MHLGSLLAALSSYLQARTAGGRWLLRIDDLDRPRCPPGADGTILGQLEAHGLQWDEAPRYQSRHVQDYRDALGLLRDRQLTYRCTCTRARLREASRAGPDGAVYAGTCWPGAPGSGRAALRLRVGEGRLEFPDRWGGRLGRDLATEIGDIIVLRADGQPAYQLACVIDDDAQGITEVVRGADLLGSSFQQIALRRVLGKPALAYGHVPVLTDARGRKLSKQNHAPAIDNRRAAANLQACLMLLGLPAEPALSSATPAETLAWAAARWGAARMSWTAQSGAAITYNALQQTGLFSP